MGVVTASARTIPLRATGKALGMVSIIIDTRPETSRQSGPPFIRHMNISIFAAAFSNSPARCDATDTGRGEVSCPGRRRHSPISSVSSATGMEDKIAHSGTLLQQPTGRDRAPVD